MRTAVPDGRCDARLALLSVADTTAAAAAHGVVTVLGNGLTPDQGLLAAIPPHALIDGL